MPVYTLKDIKEHTSSKTCWLVVHGKVYDVTEFLEEHPGGYDIILSATGKDATQDFEEIGHSNSAKKLLEKYLIGEYEGGDSAPAAQVPQQNQKKERPKDAATRAFHVLLPILILTFALALNLYYSKK